MKFEDILPALREGYSANNPKMIPGTYLKIEGNYLYEYHCNGYYCFSIAYTELILRDDWEIIK